MTLGKAISVRHNSLKKMHNGTDNSICIIMESNRQVPQINNFGVIILIGNIFVCIAVALVISLANTDSSLIVLALTHCFLLLTPTPHYLLNDLSQRTKTNYSRHLAKTH